MNVFNVADFLKVISSIMSNHFHQIDNISSRFQGSRRENGQDCMLGEIEEAVQQGILKPAADIKVIKEIEDENCKGLFYESPIPEIITKGHAVNTGRIALIQEIAEFSSYILLPTKYSFRKTVHIYSIVMALISKIWKNKGFKIFSFHM